MTLGTRLLSAVRTAITWLGQKPETNATLRIHLSPALLDELRAIAESRGVTVTEHLRRCVSLERNLFTDPDAVVTVTDSDGHQRTIRLHPPTSDELAH